jgi:DNA-binding LytR/AlgR family response regulator
MKEEIIKCIAIDDDPALLRITESLIKRTPLLELVHSFEDPFKAAAYLSKNEVPLIFLDIEMPGITGLELISSMKQPPAIIIISSKKEYAIDAFDLNVIDYLVKPIVDYSRFLKAVLKVKDSLQKTTGQALGTDSSFFVKVDSVLHNLSLDDILWVEAFGDYIKIKTAAKVMTALGTMKAMEAKLPDSVFARVHRSYIVNVKKVSEIDLANLQIGDKSIPISAFYREALMKKIKLL